MGEAASTAVLTVEDIGEKFPDSRSELKFLVPLQDSTIKIGDRHRFSVQGKCNLQCPVGPVINEVFCSDLQSVSGDQLAARQRHPDQR